MPRLREILPLLPHKGRVSGDVRCGFLAWTSRTRTRHSVEVDRAGVVSARENRASVSAAEEERPVRRRVLDAVEEFPGFHTRGVAQLAEVSPPLALYHLDTLEQLGVLLSFREGHFTRWFPSAPRPDLQGDEDRYWLAQLRVPMRRRILEVLLEQSPLRHRELLQHVPIGPSALSYQLQRLTDAGLVGPEPGTRCNIVLDEDRLQRLLKAWPPLPCEEY